MPRPQGLAGSPQPIRPWPTLHGGGSAQAAEGLQLRPGLDNQLGSSKHSVRVMNTAASCSAAHSACVCMCVYVMLGQESCVRMWMCVCGCDGWPSEPDESPVPHAPTHTPYGVALGLFIRLSLCCSPGPKPRLDPSSLILGPKPRLDPILSPQNLARALTTSPMSPLCMQAWLPTAIRVGSGS